MLLHTAIHQVGSLHEQVLSRRTSRRREERLLLRQLLPPMFLFLALIVQLWVRLSVIESGYRLEEVRRGALQSDTQLREQKLRYSFLSRPDVVQERATNELGMSSLAPQSIRRVGEVTSISGLALAADEAGHE